MIRWIVLTVFLGGCGNHIDLRFVDQEPRHIAVGESQRYALDPGDSSDVLKSGTLTMTVVSIDDKETVIRGDAKLATVIGNKDYTIVGALENELLTPEFLEDLREKKTHKAKNADITYLGLTKQACDVVRLTSIKGNEGLALEPTVCVGNGTVPAVMVRLSVAGSDIKASFKASN